MFSQTVGFKSLYIQKSLEKGALSPYQFLDKTTIIQVVDYLFHCIKRIATKKNTIS